MLLIKKITFFPYSWQKLFHSNILKAINAYSHIYFNVFMAILALLFFGKFYFQINLC